MDGNPSFATGPVRGWEQREVGWGVDGAGCAGVGVDGMVVLEPGPMDMRHLKGEMVRLLRTGMAGSGSGGIVQERPRVRSILPRVKT